MNFSHASYEQYERVKKIVEKYNKDKKKNIKMIADLQGPRIRIGSLPEQGLYLKKDQEFKFIFKKNEVYEEGIIPINSSDLHLDINKNDPLFLSNGEIELKVNAVDRLKGLIKATVIRGGLLTSRKGINVPHTNIKKGGLTPKDIKDVEFAIGAGVDCIALSFVQTKTDVERLRTLINDDKIKIISKIERAIALENINEIIKASDMVMIARGDLGIEIPIQELPIIQKYLVKFSHWHAKPAIIATQILSSMINSPRPTRAEVSDIANAVLDGGDMVMLSDETAIGNYSSEAVNILKKVLIRTERYLGKQDINC